MICYDSIFWMLNKISCVFMSVKNSNTTYGCYIGHFGIKIQIVLFNAQKKSIKKNH